jgi:hypothetical protein
MEQPQPLVIEIEPFNIEDFDEDEIPDRGNNFGRHADIADNFGDQSTIFGDDVDEIMSESKSESDPDSDSGDFFFGDLDF